MADSGNFRHGDVLLLGVSPPPMSTCYLAKGSQSFRTCGVILEDTHDGYAICDRCCFATQALRSTSTPGCPELTYGSTPGSCPSFALHLQTCLPESQKDVLSDGSGCRGTQKPAHSALQRALLDRLSLGDEVGEVHGTQAPPQPTPELLHRVEVRRARRYVKQLDASVAASAAASWGTKE